MSFSKVDPSVMRKIILEGKPLVMQAIIGNGIVKRFPMEVKWLQCELDVVIERFNERIRELQRKDISKDDSRSVSGKKEEQEISEKDKKIMLKRIENQKKRGGGAPLWKLKKKF